MLRLHHIVETTGSGVGDLVTLDEARDAPVRPGGDWLYEFTDDVPCAAEGEAARSRLQLRAFAVRRPDRPVIDMIGARLAAAGRRRQGLAYSKFPIPDRTPRAAGLPADFEPGSLVDPGWTPSRPPPLPTFRKEGWSAMSVISAAALTLMFVSGTALAVFAALAA